MVVVVVGGTEEDGGKQGVGNMTPRDTLLDLGMRPWWKDPQAESGEVSHELPLLSPSPTGGEL